MKRNLLFFLVMVLMVLSFGNAFAAPSFGITTTTGGLKLGDNGPNDNTVRSGQHALIVDGSNVYWLRTYNDYDVVLDQSDDNGVTWKYSIVIASGPNKATRNSNIAINPVTKALHFTWSDHDPSTDRMSLYYSNRTTTTEVNGSISGGDDNSIAVDGNGVIHIIFSSYDDLIYYTSSSDNGVTFSEPTPIGAEGRGTLIADNAGNLYLAYCDGGSGGLSLAKKLANSQQWNFSIITSSTDIGGNPSMVVYNSSIIYCAIGGTNIIYASLDGGQTWRANPVPSANNAPTVPSSIVSLAVSSTGIISYTWDGADGVHFVRTTRRLDLSPSSWGPAVLALALPADEGYTSTGYPNVAVDSAGKAYIAATKYYGSFGSVTLFTKER